MEEDTWKKDETPYLVFPCSKCANFMYVKTIKKKKKCLRCGRSHTVNNISNTGEVVKGMTNAVKMIKIKQNELAVKELGHHPDFQTTDGFQIHQAPSKIINSTLEQNNDTLSRKFRDLLVELSLMHKKFPFYLIEIGADKYNIPASELKSLARTFLEQGSLIQTDNNSFKFEIFNH